MELAEEWRPIPGHPGYEASSLGRIRGVDRVLVNRNGIARRWRGRVLAININPQGYVHVSLGDSAPGKAGNAGNAHRFVALAFLGPPPLGTEVCHDNGVRTDNRVSNLRYDTHSNNQRDRRLHGTDHEVKKTHCPAGHAYDEANTYRDGKGSRRCRTCNRERSTKAARDDRLRRALA